ncbi:MAG: 6-phosphofructokinase [Akkermansia sp.]|nr:6-phosphofructokinase [Akkermansia sp.]
MTSGGDAAGMNPAIKAAVDHSRSLGVDPYVVYDGLEGLIDGKIRLASNELTRDMIYRGGTLLRSSRSKRFFEYECRKQAYMHLKERGIDKLVIMGGDGSFRALNDFFNDFEIPFAGIPATIDNDIAGTDYCLGVDTAQNVILNCIDSVRDTARSHHRAFVIETMGRDCGYLAMTTALCSGADICIVPEIPYDLESIYDRLQGAIKEEGSCVIAVVAEGTRVAQYLTRWLTERAGMDTRLTVLGHVQRGGSPTARDRLMGTRFATRAVDALLNDEINKIMVYRDGLYSYATLDSVAGQQYAVNEEIVSLCRGLSR